MWNRYVLKINMIKKFNLILRHAVVSVCCALSDYLFFLALYSMFHLPLIFSFLISYIIVSSIGFLGHLYFTFKLEKIEIKNIYYFVSQLFLAGIIGYIILKFFLLYLSAPYAKLLQLFFVFFFSVIYGKFITFKK